MPKGVPNKRYTGAFKQMVVETMMQDKLSYCEAARQFDISDHKRVASWERIYLMECPEGLYIERRGRGRIIISKSTTSTTNANASAADFDHTNMAHKV